MPSTGGTAHPARAVHPARILAADPGTRWQSLRFLSRDRDDTDGEAFDAVVAADETEILQSAPRVPRRNAHGGRTTGSIRRAALEPVLIRGEAHARQVWPPAGGTATPTDLTRPDGDYRPMPGNGPTPPCTTSTPAECCGTRSSAA
ncbi:integrase [Streptomyces sp. NPDC050388]|uniref:integrase n=1 Tax=Streptomyces sp. NPDC050388 TaxID=3155781 RepID=UPI0034239725